MRSQTGAQNAGYETIFTTWRSSSPAPSTCDELSEATRRTSASSSLQNVSGAGRPPKRDLPRGSRSAHDDGNGNGVPVQVMPTLPHWFGLPGPADMLNPGLPCRSMVAPLGAVPWNVKVSPK